MRGEDSEFYVRSNLGSRTIGFLNFIDQEPDKLVDNLKLNTNKKKKGNCLPPKKVFFIKKK